MNNENARNLTDFITKHVDEIARREKEREMREFALQTSLQKIHSLIHEIKLGFTEVGDKLKNETNIRYEVYPQHYVPAKSREEPATMPSIEVRFFVPQVDQADETRASIKYEFSPHHDNYTVDTYPPPLQFARNSAQVKAYPTNNLSKDEAQQNVIALLGRTSF